MHIHIIEPFYGGSHKAFTDAIQQKSRHKITVDSMPPRFWKWRLSGSPFILVEHFLNMETKPDLLLFSDTIDVSSFVAMAGKKAVDVPKVIYFHENQITYPLSSDDENDVHYPLINITSAMVCDEVWFNSDFHRRVFLEGLNPFLNQFPDFVPAHLYEIINYKSQVLPVPVKPLPNSIPPKPKNNCLRILWNHRWEYDKDPDSFFKALERLVFEGIDFEVAVLGEDFKRKPPVFERAQETLGERIVVFGYQESREEYASWVRSCDVVVSCARQEYFGISVAEAVLAGCKPILPNRLVYPDFFEESIRKQYLYNDENELIKMLRDASRNLEELRANTNYNFYDEYVSDNVVKRFDDHFKRVISNF